MPDYEKILLAVAPHGKAAIRSGFAASIEACIAHAELTTPLRLAHFLAQCAHESAGMATTTEYASGRAYEGRRDLGNDQRGDGVRFKGRGLIQITGRANYERVGKAIKIELISNPPTAALFPAAALSAAQFWRERDINKDADRDDVCAVTRLVNGGENGLADRAGYLARARRALANLKGELIARAAEETQKATVKAASGGALSATAAASLASLHPAAQSPVSPVVVGALAFAAVAGAAGLVVAINRHKQAAAELTAAAEAV